MFGYHPTSNEVKILLEKTALPILSSQYQKPRRNGVGLLNTYKLGQVGKQLRVKCGEDASCFTDKIEQNTTYQFSVDHSSFLREVHRSFPECAVNTTFSSESNNYRLQHKETSL